MDDLVWKIEESEQIEDCRVFTVHRNRASIVRDGKKRSHDFFYIDSNDWVNVIPVTAAGEVVLIEQYRAGIDAVTLEIPGGTVDATDTSSREAGMRELMEETGYAAEEFIFLGRTHPNPAIQSNSCDTYLATNVKRLEQPRFDGTEEIVLRIVPLLTVPTLIRDSSITHALVIVAFHYLDLFKQNPDRANS